MAQNQCDFERIDGHSLTSQANLNSTQSENYINLGMLINNLEKDPQTFWGAINSYFYKQITPLDKNKIDTLISQLSVPPQDDKVFESKDELLQVEDIVNPEYLLSLNNNHHHNLDSINKRQKTKSEIDRITVELEKITKDQRILHIENVQRLFELKDRIIRDEDQQNESDYSPLVYKLISNENVCQKSQNINQLVFSKDSMQFQADFIKSLILELEDSQTAESIKYVIDCKKNGQIHEFCIIFDKAISDTEIWIKEGLLDKFDKLRDQSLFKIHAIPQKVSKSLSTFNIGALFSCAQKQIHRRLDIKERPWKDIIINSLGNNPTELSNIFYKEQMQLKANQLELCHHCRYLFPKEFTYGCNYHSSKMGYFTSDTNLTKGAATLLKEMENNESLSYLYKWNEEKNEYICERKYCANCLKSNYDINIHSMRSDHNWLCPFCKGVCFCSRCLRNDQINKLVQVYLDIGGDSKTIVKESSLRNILWKTINRIPQPIEEEGDHLLTLPRPLNSAGKHKYSIKKKNVRRKVRNSTIEHEVCKKMKITIDKEKLLPSKRQKKKATEYSSKNSSRRSRSKNKELSRAQEEPLLSYKKNFCRTSKSSLDLVDIQSKLPSLNFQSLKVDTINDLPKFRFQFQDKN